MTRYRVPVSNPLLEQAEHWAPVEGFRLVSVDGPLLAEPRVTICTFEDDNAPPELEGKLVEPQLTSQCDDEGKVTATITGRTVIGACS